MYDLFAHIILYFFVYSLLGRVWETIYASNQVKRPVYRGFFLGPYCPTYGLGALTVIYLFTPLQELPLVLFLVSAVAMMIIELIMSWVLERLFHTRWWDYSDHWLNYQGRISAPTAFLWGMLCLMLVYLIHPHVIGLSNMLYGQFSLLLPVVLIAIWLIDMCITTISIVRFNGLLRDFEATHGTDYTIDDVLRFIRTHRSRHRLGFTERRLLVAFPVAENKRFPKLRESFLQADTIARQSAKLEK